MKKKILAAMLAMSLVMPSVMVNAEDGATEKALVDNEGIVMTKTFEADTEANDGSGTLTLESYVTGDMISTETSKPTDIVMVLDASGSMDEQITLMDKNADPTGILKPEYAEYYRYNGALYTDLDMRYHNGKWQYYGRAGLSLTKKWRDLDATWLDADISITKMNALKIATQEFVDSALTKDDVKISTVSFTYEDNTWSSDVDKTEVVTQLTDDAASLKTDIEGIRTWNGTNTHRGLEEAKNVLDGIERDSKKVVILFTDGDAEDENAAKTVANTIKTTGAEIYSVGIGATAQDFLKKVSSNYDENGNYIGDENATYYQSATTGADLEAIFESISEDIGGASVELDTSTVVKDIMSPYFEVNGDVENIIIKTAECIAIDGTTPTFATPMEDNSLTAEKDGKNVSVTGFDFGTNWVGSDNGVPHGKKLIIEIPVKPIEGFMGGNGVPTNGEAGIYVAGEAMETVASPSAYVPINFAPTVDDKTIYRGNSVAKEEIYSPLGADSLLDDFVDITVTIGGNAITDLTPVDCTDYTLNYTATPKQEGKISEESGTDDFKIHVLQPTFEVNPDLWVNYGTVVDMDENIVVEDSLKYESTCECTDTTKPAISGDEPELSVKFTNADGDEISDESITVNEEQVIKAQIKVNDTVLDNPNGVTNIHLNMYDLKLTKSVADAADWAKYGQDLILNVTQNDVTTKVVVDKECLDDGREVITVSDLYAGAPTTVSEDTDWAWRWNPEYSTTTNGVTLNDGAFTFAYDPEISEIEQSKQIVDFSITNTISNKNWIALTDMIKNVFAQEGGNE